MNTLCRRLMMQEHSRLIASIVLSLMTAIVLSNSSYAGSYVDLRHIEPISGDAASGAAKTVVCEACHGPSGNSIVSQFPSLAGQRADYVYHRLVAFKFVNPKDPNYASTPMPAQVQNLSDQDMRNIATYFASQAPAAPAPLPASVDGRGEALYSGGDPSHGVPPCQGCHGAGALGGPVASGRQYLAYPLLRGQHATYLVLRLTHFRNKPTDRSTNDFIMQGVARTLDDGSIQSLAAWLESLPPSRVN
jgi:cytochrome c553